MIEEFVARFNASRHPRAAALRGYLERNPGVRSFVRVPFRVLRIIRALFTALHEWIWPRIDRHTRAIMEARAVGTTVAVEDLDRVWRGGRAAKRALCVGGVADVDQLEVVLRCSGIRSVTKCLTDAGSRAVIPNLRGYDLIVAAVSSSSAADLDELERSRSSRSEFIRVSETASPSMEPHRLPVVRRRENDDPTRSLHERISTGETLRVVLVNDVGFQYGAGNAMKRQAASFLLNGWEVSVVAWRPGPDVAAPAITGLNNLDNWRGVHRLPHIARPQEKLASEDIIADVAALVHSFNPDLVVVGNIHSAGWPVGMLPALQRPGTTVVAYMHDTYFVTGRCAQPGSCILYRTGCNATCPTADEYPRLARDKIAGAWQDRADVFTGSSAVPLIANSNWSKDIVQQRFGSRARTEVVHLALDHHLFAPFSRALARRLLKLPDDKTIVVMGAVDVRSQWKGGPLFHAVHQALLARDDVAVVLFGQASERLASARSFGFVRDERLMPFILNAADIFVTAAIAESFGQTLLEASACGLPLVAFNIGGIKDIVVHNQTGILVDRLSAEDLLAAIDALIVDPARRKQLGQNGRERVERQFTLNHQGRSWIEYLQNL
jgi:glycosyltransferase involved in cell wall biosynthesis